MTDRNLGSGFLDLELRAEVWLATEDVPLGRLLELDRGKTLPLARDPDAPVELVINGAVVAAGELVVVDGHFGFRVTRTSQQLLAGLPASAGARPPSVPAAAEPAPADGKPPAEDAPDTETQP
jgi:hypothetical protein